MTRKEFLTKLENSLKGHLTKDDITEILSDYSDIFDNGIANEKSEDEIIREIGLPESISCSIIGDKNKDAELDTLNIAPMSKRLIAYFIDGIVVTLLIVFLYVAFSAIYERITININQGDIIEQIKNGSVLSDNNFSEVTFTDSRGKSTITLTKDGKVIFKGSSSDYSDLIKKLGITKNNFSSVSTVTDGSSSFPVSVIMQLYMIIYLIIVGLFNVITAFELWITQGYTLGKWIAKIKVENINGKKMNFLNAFTREALIKCALNAITVGILSIVSFIISTVRPDRKALHDMATNTIVVNVKR